MNVPQQTEVETTEENIKDTITHVQKGEGIEQQGQKTADGNVEKCKQLNRNKCRRQIKDIEGICRSTF